MIILNFGHPLTDEHLQRIHEIANAIVEQVMEIKAQFDHARPFAEQVVAVVDDLGIDARQWQTHSFLINPPTLNIIAVTLLAELNGRMGYFPRVLRLQPNDQPPPPYQVAEIIDLRAVRDAARGKR